MKYEAVHRRTGRFRVSYDGVGGRTLIEGAGCRTESLTAQEDLLERISGRALSDSQFDSMCEMFFRKTARCRFDVRDLQFA